MQDYKYPSLASVAIFLSIAFLLGGDKVLDSMSDSLRTGMAILCLAVALGIVLYMFLDIGIQKKKKKKQTRDNQGNMSMNITIDSRDFISMDTERAKVFFDGLERITIKKQLAQGGQNGRTEETARETKAEKTEKGSQA